MRVGIDCRKIADFGIGTYVRGLVHGLAALGTDDEIVVFIPSFARDQVPHGVQCVVSDVPNYTIRELIVVGRQVAKARLDVFHSPHFVLPWTSCPTIATIHDVIPFHFPPPNPVASLYLSVMVQRALNKSVRVLTVSEAAKRSILESFDVDGSKILVGEPEPPAMPPYFLFVGNDKPHKNVGRLIDAFTEVQRRDRGMGLTVVGAEFDRFRGVPGVTTTGFVTAERLAAIYRGATALVMPSLEEGFGLPVAEAMASGTPVIASDIPSLREVAGDAALYVDPRSTTSLVDAMMRVADMRDELAARGRRRAALFTWRRCAELTRQVYRSVV
jgi:glycosyltransferase involved in cell wall biosynthesis